MVLVLALGLTTMSLAVEYTWVQKVNMPTARWLHSASVVDGKIYVIGGSSSEPNPQLIRPVEVYDPVTDKWTTVTDIPTPRAAFSTSVLDGKIYAIGGSSAAYSPFSVVEEYDPVIDTWSSKAAMSTSRMGLSTSMVDGKIYAIGGAVGLPLAGLKIVEEYDPVTDTWTRKADMPFGVWALCTAVVDVKIYALGGRPGVLARPYVQEYNPATDTWTRKSDMPVSTSNMGSVVLGDKIIVIGGWLRSENDPYTIVQMYDPDTDIWTIEGDAPFLRASFSASVVNNRIYAIGGTDRHHPCLATSTVYELTVSGPPPDFNGDGIVDAVDMCLMIDYWGTDEPLCDIGPMPWGDGIVDVQDLVVLAEHLFEVYPSANTVDVNEADNGGQIELEQGKLLVVTLESNPSTGYQWELVENNESVLKQFGQKGYKPAETSNPRVGGGGWEIFRFKAVSTGQTTLEFVYRRPWEDAEPLKTFYIQVTVN